MGVSVANLIMCGVCDTIGSLYRSQNVPVHVNTDRIGSFAQCGDDAPGARQERPGDIEHSNGVVGEVQVTPPGGGIPAGPGRLLRSPGQGSRGFTMIARLRISSPLYGTTARWPREGSAG